MAKGKGKSKGKKPAFLKEGSPADIRADKREARKAGKSAGAYEGSPADLRMEKKGK